jgi:hypothetical protein
MAKRSQHSFLKRQKEIKRKEHAAEKMARRHGKLVTGRTGAEEEQQVDQPEEQPEEQQAGQPEETNGETPRAEEKS